MKWPLSLLCVAALSSGAQSIDDVLAWLPADTETVVAAPAAFELSPASPAIIASEARYFLLAPFFDAMLDRQWIDRGVNIRSAMLAARRFHDWPTERGEPMGLGLGAFEGCSWIQFIAQPVFPAQRFEEIAGHRVGIHRSTLTTARSGFIDYFAALLTPNEILLCNDRWFLETVLQRRASGAARAALPQVLPEWAFVDRSAPVWGIRHYASTVVGRDPTHPRFGSEFPDKQAIGIALNVSDKVTVAALSGSPALFQRLADGTPAREVGNGVWEIDTDLFVAIVALGFAYHM